MSHAPDSPIRQKERMHKFVALNVLICCVLLLLNPGCSPGLWGSLTGERSMLLVFYYLPVCFGALIVEMGVGLGTLILNTMRRDYQGILMSLFLCIAAVVCFHFTPLLLSRVLCPR